MTAENAAGRDLERALGDGATPRFFSCAARDLFSAAQEIGYENIDKMLEYDGTRRAVHRSSWAKTGAVVAKTGEDGFLPRPIEHESSLERYVAISALLHPNTWGLKCQPRRVSFDQKVDGVGHNILDFLLTLKTGEKYYLFVKNEERLSKIKQTLICEQIRLQLPEGYGFAVLSEVNFPPTVRGNLERMFLAKRFPNPEADQRLEYILTDLIDVSCFTVEELVFRCVMGRSKAEQGVYFDAVLRAIADHRLVAERCELIDYPTVVRCAP